MSNNHHKIHYVELPMVDIAATKAFYSAVFGWTFQDWGPTYISFHGAGLDGGFTTDGATPTATHGALVIFYSDDLSASLQSIKTAGGTITQDIFSFPGGSRFHFLDPSGNQLAVWTYDNE
ncbi:MAG: VOC family protein [Pseudomonadota bacterium]